MHKGKFFIHLYFIHILHTLFIAPFFNIHNIGFPTRHINTFIYNTSKPKILIISVLLGIICISTPLKKFSLHQTLLVFLTLKDLRGQGKMKEKKTQTSKCNKLFDKNGDLRACGRMQKGPSVIPWNVTGFLLPRGLRGRQSRSGVWIWHADGQASICRLCSWYHPSGL